MGSGNNVLPGSIHSLLYEQKMPSGNGMYERLVDYRQQMSSSSQEPIFVNDFDLTSVQKRELLNSMLLMKYEGDSLDIIPSCECGSIREAGKVGVLCSNCNTTVMPITERPLESTLWVKPPKGVSVFIAPAVWLILGPAMTHSGVSLLKWLTDPFYRPDKTIAHVMKLQKAGIKRGLNYFHANFDHIVNVLFDINAFRVSKPTRSVTLQAVRDEIRRFITENRDRIFTPFLPLPSKLTFIVESVGGINYTDTSITDAIDAVYNIVAIDTTGIAITLRGRESRAVKCIEQFAAYYWYFAGDPLGYKFGWVRRHILGSRMDFTARAVIISISKPHHYEDICLPWGVMINLHKIEISNKLLKSGRSPNEIHNFIESHIHRYSEYMDMLLTEVIGDGPGGKLSCLLQRNPTLNRGNVQRVYITEFFKDPTINAIGVSTLILKQLNADFDGDELHVMPALDLAIAKVFDRMAPHLSVADLNKPKTISGYLTLPTQVLSIAANYLNAALH